MVQMQLDLVGEHRKVCKTCGMEYIPSNILDATMHKKFHAINVGGIDFARPVIERLRKHQMWTGSEGSFVSAIGRKDTLALRKRASDVLKIVNTELSAVPISDEELWGLAGRTFFADAQREASASPDASAPTVDEIDMPLVDRFKVYLYLRGNKCVGVCLAERIWEAFTVIDQPDVYEQTCRLPVTSESSSVSVSTTADPAVLGISRIWTSSQFRKQGIAAKLLDLARSDFMYGMIVDKERVAFSQPTESGGNLARKWFGRQSGWHVYID
jgi:ribosomal protein S18 acetylase RimI-like enzyme